MSPIVSEDASENRNTAMNTHAIPRTNPEPTDTEIDFKVGNGIAASRTVSSMAFRTLSSDRMAVLRAETAQPETPTNRQDLNETAGVTTSTPPTFSLNSHMPSNNGSTKAINDGDDWDTSEPAPTFLLEITGDWGASEDFITQQIWHLVLSKMERDFFFSRPETYNSHEELINPMSVKDVEDWLYPVIEADERNPGWEESSFDEIDAHEHEWLEVDNEQRFKFEYREFYDERFLDYEY